jgi:hypothetical protein
MVVGLIFIVLKLTGNIDWSWWWVLSPFWICALIWILLLACIGGVFAVTYFRKPWWER